MKCRKCGKLIPLSDKYCVYCGSGTGLFPVRILRGFVERLPIWARWIGASVFLISIGVLVAFPLLYKHTPPVPTPTPQPVPTSQPSILLTEDASTLVERSTVYSAYISTTAPRVDGILTPGEWPEPDFTKTFDYTVDGTKKTGDMNGYFLNDEYFLYAAITVSAEDFKENILEEEVGFWSLDLWFDSDNDGIIGTGNDIARFWKSSYSDSHVGGDGTVISDVKRNGAGACKFSPSNKMYTYEFQIPLNSRDSEDLAVEPGDTIGVKLLIAERQQNPTSKNYDTIGSVGWPVAQGKLDGSKYGKLVLAVKPTGSY